MTTEGLFIFIAILLGSVLGQPDPDPWTPDSDKKWSHEDIPRIDSKSDTLGVHLVFISGDDPILKKYKYYFKAQKEDKTGFYLKDNNGKTIYSQEPKVELKNMKAKLTIVTHGSREVVSIKDNNQEFGVKYEINTMSPQNLAGAIQAFIEETGFTPHERARFIVCNAGSQAASNYMTEFIKDLNNRGINIPEVVAYRTFAVQKRNTIGVIISPITTYPEELIWHFEKKGITVDEDIFINKLLKAKIFQSKVDSSSKNEVRVLYKLQDGEVHRTKLIKTNDNNNARQHLESVINVENAEENFFLQLDNCIKRFCENRGVISRKRPRLSRERRRRSPSVCSLTEEKALDEYIIKEKSLTIEDGKVQVEVANRQNPEETHSISFPLDEPFYMEQIKETAKLRASQVKGGGRQFLEQINKGMAVYGVVAGFLGAGKFFAENDTIRGAFTLTQSLHGLGEMAGLNQQLSRMSQKIFQKGLQKATVALGAEKSFAKISSSVERFSESAAGQFLKDIPIVGLGFQFNFIAEDSIAIQESDRSDPQQNKYLGLKVTNLVLDVSTTVLTLAEVAFPPAAIVLEPIIIGLTVARMAIGDFYCDVVSELNQLPKGASNFDKMASVIVGLEEGAVDFVTGGLLRELNALEKEQRQNQELLRNLATPESYFKIIANDGKASTLDLTEGTLSQYGGFVTVRLSNDGNITIQIGGVPDGQGGVKTIKKLFHNPSIQSIALAVGESSQLLYTEKAAHLLWVIPVDYTKVICGEIKLHSSLFGTYYGNDKANQFFAPQLPTKMQSLPSTDACAYGRQDLEFVMKNYHYTIYGHGGDDTFFLGPQTSKLSGGEGRDFYIFPTAGSYAEIDNFAHDTFEDQMLIKAPFSHIDCVRKNTDLLLVYGPQRYTVTVRDWFTHSNANHYQHMKFQSADGVRFKVADMGLVGHRFHVNCIPETLDKTRSQSPVSIRLVGDFKSVITVLGSNYSDSIVGNEKNNVFNGGPGADMLEGGEGADTYEIFQGQGCDKVNNFAKDQKVDLVVFNVPLNRISAQLKGEDLLVFDEEDKNLTCIWFTKWNAGSLFQHMAFLSSDHVTFHISSNDGELETTALIVDLSKDTHGSTVNLSEPNHLLNVISVFDSTHDDVILGNALGNFLSCSGGKDLLQGAGGSDKYVIKSGCKSARITNYAQDQASDVLFLEHPFENLRVRYQSSDLVLIVENSDIEVRLQNWFMGKQFQHLVLQTIDGVISMLPLNVSEPEVLTPFEINLSQENCTDYKRKFDFSKDPFTKVERFKAKSSKCSYSVIGNNMDNYIDPGIGNAINYQYLKGGNGSDTYVFGHKYGYVNEIDNEAKDMKTDNLFFQVLYKDIEVLLKHPHVILYSRSRNDSVQVHLLKYLEGPEKQHLLIRSSDGVSFWVNPNSSPYKTVVSIDTSTSTKSCNISCAEGEEYLRVSQIYGATGFSNYVTGSRSSSVIIGGNMADYLLGNEGSERIEGHGGNDIINGQSGDDNLLGGKGDDVIRGGAGNDMIYGGWGADRIDGGPGVDVVFFSGDVRTSTGIKVDLNTGRGEWADAENDTYTDVEDVSGTNFNDLIIGDEEDNELVGKFGNDTLVPGHGSDVLFGGPGNDLYILDDCSGVKYINNFASDMALDYILLRNFNATDACFFLQEGTLIISFSHHNPLLSLLQRDSLTVVLYNWSNNDSFYQHVDFVFAQNSLVKSSFFSSAEEISRTLLEINSTRPTLYTRHASEMTVDIEIKAPQIEEKTSYTLNSNLQYHLKVSDPLFFSESLQWTNQSLIEYSGLLSGVNYTFQFLVSFCEVPVLVLAEMTHLTNPNPPTSVNLTHISHSNAMINWTPPSTDSDPNNSQYTYVVEVQSKEDESPMQIVTNHTHLEIMNLNPATHYKLSVSSAIKGVKSLKSITQIIETPNLCPNFTAPVGARVVDEKMTRHGPVVVLECNKGYRSTSSLVIPCLGDRSLRLCVPKSCAHQGNVFDHGEFFHKVCLDLSFRSICNFGDIIPPVVTCCHSIPLIADGIRKYIYHVQPASISAKYYCNSGYDFSGPLKFDCDMKTGQWSSPFPILPSCTPAPCPVAPQIHHGKTLLLRILVGQYQEGDVLQLHCDEFYRPSSGDRITCRNGNWEDISSCVASVRLVNTFSTNSRLYGQIQQWKSGSWSSEVASTEAEHIARFCCKERDLKFLKMTTYPHIGVECSQLKLQTFRDDYVGIAEGNIDSGGWKIICVEDSYAALSFCQQLFPVWTTRVLDSTGFHTGYTYRCDEDCRFHTESRWCTNQIQCRAPCDPFPIPNGQVSCRSALEEQWCSVSCNRLYRLQGPSSIQCRSDGWSGDPYCIETGECGHSDERGPHSVGCLTKLWTAAGCHTEAHLSPTRTPGHWSTFNYWTVSAVRDYMATLPDSGPFTYNPDCQIEECFPGRSAVVTSEGNRKSMSELQLGDRVLSLGADGHLTFSEVILWLDRRPAARERYVLLSTEGSPEPLSLSADHVTFIAPSNATAASPVTMVPVLAKDLRRGHLLYRYRPGGGSLTASRVTDVQESEELGAYAPMTVEGNLIVDGHLASCYALQCRQYLAHLPFAPYRLFHFLRSYVPLFAHLCPLWREQEAQGMHWYARAWLQVGQWFGYPFGETCYPTELQLYHYP